MTSQVGAPPLVWAKLEPPVSQGLVSRTKLVTLLTGGHCRLVVICAPAGWGKTTLLADWSTISWETRPFGWIALDAADNDPIRFWSHLIEATRRIDPDLRLDASALLRVPGLDVLSNVLPVLVNELATASRPGVLVLDDYHVITNPDIDEQLAFLVERLPATGVEIVVASRSAPALPLDRLRASGELIEIDATQLRFSADEAVALINGLHRLGLDPDLVARLTDCTAGRAAGLCLVVLALRDRDGATELMRTFAGTDRPMVDLLRAEVFARQPEEVRRFLRRTAILPRLCGELCDRVTGGGGSVELLAELKLSNMFLTSLGTRREWFRYHPLFSELLLGELQRVEPELVGQLHRRAAEWLVTSGEVTDAIGHYVAAGAHAEAAELVAQHWHPFVQARLDVTVAGWLQALPAEVVRTDARLCIAAAMVSLSQGRGDDAARWITAIERVEPAGAFHDGFSSAASGAATTRAILGLTRGELTDAQQAARRAAGLEQPSSPWHAVAVNIYGISLRWMGRSEHAQQALTAGVAAARCGGIQVMPIVYGLGHLAGLHADRGDWRSAEEQATEALQLAAEHGVAENWVCGMSHLVQGRVLSASGNLSGAQPTLVRGIELARRGAGRLDVAWGTLTLAGVLAGLDDETGARAALAQARCTLRTCPDPGPMLHDLLAATARRIGAHLSL